MSKSPNMPAGIALKGRLPEGKILSLEEIEKLDFSFNLLTKEAEREE